MKTTILLLVLLCLLPCARALSSASGALDLAPLVYARKVNGLDALRPGVPNIGYFGNMKVQGFPTQQTEVSVGYDETNLYVIFRCKEAEMAKLVAKHTGHDGEVYHDDDVEVFLDTKHDHNTYFQLITNCAGVRYEARDNAGPDSWNGEWKVDIAKNADGWMAAFTIPFSSMGVKMPAPGTTWGANLVRREQPKTEASSWSSIKVDAHWPTGFGHLVFGDENSPVISAQPVDIKAPGKFTARLSMSNLSEAKAEFSAEPQVDGRALATERKSMNPGEGAWSFAFQFTDEGDRRFCITVKDAKDNLVMRTPPAPIDIPAHRARLRSYLQQARALKPSTIESKQRKAEVLHTLKQISSLAAPAEQGGGRWARLDAALNAASLQMARVGYSCADKASTGYVVGSETSIVKVRCDRPFTGGLNAPIKISACRDEFEAAQAVIVAYDKALKGVSVSVSALKGPGGAAIPTSAIQLNRVGYVKTRKPVYEVDYVGLWADPLMDISPFDVKKGLVQPVWVTVRPTEKTPAGVYRGKLTIRPANAPAQTIPLEVRVWDFAIPKTSHLKNAFAMCEGQLEAWYGKIDDDLRRNYYQFMLDHRLNPINMYSAAAMPTKNLMPFAVEHGLNAFPLTYINENLDEAKRAVLLKDLEEREAFLKANGWWDMAYIYGFDEVQPDKVPALKSMFGWVKENFPDLPRMCTAAPRKDLKGYVDIWCPILHGYNHQTAQEYTKAGDKVWWYVAWIPSHPYPNILTDYSAIDHRTLFWMTWKYQVPGFLYYCVNLWDSNRVPTDIKVDWHYPQEKDVYEGLKAGKRWPELRWNTFTFEGCNGDGNLIYPGPNGKPMSSIRMECIRDGMEDYEYFYMLNDLVARAEQSGKADTATLAEARKLLGIDETVVKSTFEYTKDPRVMLNARQQVAEMIEKLGAIANP